ncbi:MAG: FeoA family protein [Desulfurococcaceae archaeon]
MKEERVFPLALLGEGERARIVEFDEERLGQSFVAHGEACSGGCGFCHGKRKERPEGWGKLKRLIDMGLERGRIVEVIRNRAGQPLVVLLENSQIAISRGLAMKILVSKEEVRI